MVDENREEKATTSSKNRKRAKYGGNTSNSRAAPMRWFSLGWKLFCALAILLGVVTSLYNLSAQVSVMSTGPVDPHDPFSTPFYVHNRSYLPIRNVSFECVLREVEWKEGGGIINIGTRTDAPPIDSIEAGEATTTFCLFPPWRATIKSADIEVLVKYSPFLLPWQKEKSYRFKTIEKQDGTLRWLHMALSQ